MPDDDTVTLPDEPEELTRVRSFKLAKLRSFGYSEPDARELAEHGVDVHYVQALLVRGASLSEAARIAR